MRRPVFNSIFADEMNHYMDDRVAAGFQESGYYGNLRKFDRFCCEEKIITSIFTEENANRWLKRSIDEATTTHYKRINGSKHFLMYLKRKGYDVFVVRDVHFRPTDFQPHIYTKEQAQRYFLALDSYSDPRRKKAAIQYPVLFRILYCCGTRISETLRIRKMDVDLDNGIIKLFETKNNCERYIVLNDELSDLMRQFANKCFYLLSDSDYIFTTRTGNRLHENQVYDVHRICLVKAGIPYIGNGLGPRVHDWRHTMAVESFKQMVDSGLDMYVALPILSTYLGHKTIFATEKYVRLTLQIYPHIVEKFRSSVDFIFGGLANENN